MPCFHPLECWLKDGGGITFKLGEASLGLPSRFVPCGRCVGCRLERSRQWAMRCMHEASLHDSNCFLTLTYDDDHIHRLPTFVDEETGELFRSLNKRDIMLFFKRLRKRFGAGIRFFQCGEYGEKFSRPHHHAIVFNFDFPDKYYWSQRRGTKYYRSAALEELWPFGFCRIGEVTFESAAYVARYVMKKVVGKDEVVQAHYRGLQSEFVTMSRRPGIARDYFEKYKSTMYDNDSVFIRPGLVARPPRYYDRLFDLTDSESFAIVKAKRKLSAKDRPDNSFERLAVRERVLQLKLKSCVRPIES